MAQPVARDLHVDTLLTNLSIGYKNADYIADTVFPIVPVTKQSNRIAAYNQSDWYRDEAKIRTPGSASPRTGWGVDLTALYFCDRYSIAHEISDEERDNADAPFNLDMDATNLVTDKIQMRREVQFATDFMVPGVWTDKVGGVDFTKWSDYGASQPLIDMYGFQDLIEGLISRTPGTIVMGKQVWTQLRWHPDLIDLIKYTQRAQLDTDLFASLMGFDKVLIGKAIYTVSPEGTAESSVAYTRIFGKFAWIGYVPSAPSLMVPASGYTFTWNRVPNSIQYVKRMRDEEREVDIIEGNTYFDQKAVGVRAGLFMSAAVA